MRFCWSCCARVVCPCAGNAVQTPRTSGTMRRASTENGTQKLTAQLYWRHLDEFTVFHDGTQFIPMLQDGDVRDRVAIDQQQVGRVTRLDLADAVPHAHDLAAEAGGGNDRIHRREPEQLDEMFD